MGFRRRVRSIIGTGVRSIIETVERSTRDEPDAPDTTERSERTARDDGLGFRSKPDEFVNLLESNDGRLKQSDIVSRTKWSSATVSRVLSEMEAENVIRKITIGRENVVVLAGVEPEWHDPSERRSQPTAETSSSTTRDADGEAILIVEDDPSEVRLLEEAFDEVGISNPIHVVTDGSDTLEFLLQRGPYADAPRPGLVLLDLGLDLIDGIEVLEELDQRDALHGIPLVVFSRSRDPADVHDAYQYGAAAYLKKPETFEELRDLVQAMETFWVSSVVLPDQSAIATTP